MADLLAERFLFRHISTGDILREEIRENSCRGQQAKQHMNQGELVPDELVVSIVSHRLRDPSLQRQGVVLDGFPRTLPQAVMLDKELTESNLVLNRVVLFEAGREVLIQRLTGRRVCNRCGALYNIVFSPPQSDGVCDRCGGALMQRQDDNLATVQERLLVYEQQTAPLINFYKQRNLLVCVQTEQSKEDILLSLIRHLGIE